jgi:hypothetical protein
VAHEVQLASAAALFLVGCSGGATGGAQAPDATSDSPSDATADGPRDAAAQPAEDSPANPCPDVTAFDPATAKELTVVGDTPEGGIFDPSFAGAPDASTVAMAYSAVPSQETIRTHVAVSSDQGASWPSFVEANTPEAATEPSTNATECPGGACSGNLISEVPSLVYDADEPDPAKLWKLFAHRYLVAQGGTLHYSIGTIALQTAPAPSGPWTAPQKLIGWSSPSTYSSTGIATNVSSFASTQDCLALTEPGALWRPGVIDLAVGCAYLGGVGQPTTRVELLRSTDHAASWTSVGTLLRVTDASCVPGATGINASDLFTYGGAQYVSATPGGPSGLYEGCVVFSFTDVDAGTVARDDAGQAIAVRTIAPSPPTFSGACTFSASAGGYAIDVGFLQPSVTRKFRIFQPGIATP